MGRRVRVGADAGADRPGRVPGRQLSAVVLAAGEGTRMRSARPKPLHRLCGRPMVLHVLDALAELSVTRVVVVVGHRAEWVTKTLIEHAPPGMAIEFVEQVEQRGTGDAMSVALTGLPDDVGDDDGDVVVLPGDTPLLRPATLAALVRHHRASGRRRHPADRRARPTPPGTAGWCGAGTTRWPGWSSTATPPTRSSRSTRSTPRSTASGGACWPRPCAGCSPANAQGEYYLTDVVGVLYEAGHRVGSVVVEDPMEVAGVNDRAQLAVAEAELRDRINERWMRRGVTMWDPERTYIDVDVALEPDVVLLPGVILQGACVVGEPRRDRPRRPPGGHRGGGGGDGGLQRLPPVGHRGRRPRRALRRAGRGTEVPAGAVVGRDGAPPPCGRAARSRIGGQRRRRGGVASWVWNSPPAAASNWCPGARTPSWPGTSPPSWG